MIHKYQLIGNEILKRNKIKLHSKKDISLFKYDFKKKISKVFYFKFYNKLLDINGPRISLEITKDYLGFNSLSEKIILKKIILILKYYFYQLLVFRKTKTLKTEIFIVHNRNSIGYFHWVLDILPKLVLIKKKFKKKKIKICLPENLNLNFIKESLSKLNIKYKLILKNFKYNIKNGYYIPEIYPSGNPRPKQIFELKKNYAKLISKNNNNLIYISRIKSKRRKLVNDIKFQNYLIKFGFKIYFMEELTFEDQIRISSSAKIMIGLHGAGLANSVWMKKNSYLIELKPEKNLFTNCFYSLSSINKINYDYHICKKINFFKNYTKANYVIDIKKFDKKFRYKLTKIINEIKDYK